MSSQYFQIKLLFLLEDSFETSVAALEIPEANGSTSLVSLKSLKADELPSSKKDRMTFYLKKIQSNLRSGNMKNKEYYNISHHFIVKFTNIRKKKFIKFIIFNSVRIQIHNVQNIV